MGLNLFCLTCLLSVSSPFTAGMLSQADKQGCGADGFATAELRAKGQNEHGVLQHRLLLQLLSLQGGPAPREGGAASPCSWR